MSKREDPAEITRLKEAQEALQSAQDEYQRRVRDCQADLKQAQKAHDKAVRQAKKRLDDENTHFASPLLQLLGATLYRGHIAYNGMVLQLEPSMHSEIREVRGASAPAAAPNAASAGDGQPSPRTASGSDSEGSDDRRYVLTFASGGKTMEITALGDQEKSMRELEEETIGAAKVVDNVIATHRTTVETLQTRLDEAQGDMAAILTAQRHLEEAKAATAPVDSLKRQLETLRAETPKDLLKQYDHDRRKAKALKVGIIALVIIVAVVLIVLWTMGAFNG